jgi:hypothetical protein
MTVYVWTIHGKKYRKCSCINVPAVVNNQVRRATLVSVFINQRTARFTRTRLFLSLLKLALMHVCILTTCARMYIHNLCTCVYSQLVQVCMLTTCARVYIHNLCTCVHSQLVHVCTFTSPFLPDSFMARSWWKLQKCAFQGRRVCLSVRV